MSGKTERNRRRKEFGRLYQRHYFDDDRNTCFYCRDARECLDHVPPLVLMDYATPKQLREMRIPFVLVPSCLDCNQRLGARKLWTVEERLSYLYGYLSGKFEKQSKLWSEDEIMEMSPMFQKMIRARESKLRHLIERIRGIEWRQMRYDTFPQY